MNQKDIIIDSCCIGYWDEDFNPNEAIICFERLINNPCKILADKHKIKSEVEYLSFILPYVAKLFNVDRNKLRELWIDSTGYWKCFGVIK